MGKKINYGRTRTQMKTGMLKTDNLSHSAMMNMNYRHNHNYNYRESSLKFQI